MILRRPVALAGKCLAARLRDNTGTSRAGISELENARIIRVQVCQMGNRAVVELYSLKWQ